MTARFLERALRGALGDPHLSVLNTSAIDGGCINHAVRLETTQGEFFAKWNAEGPGDLFVCEAAGLEALAGAGSSVVIPRVIVAEGPRDADPAFLILEYLAPSGFRGGENDEQLGRGLAAIHRHTAATFGFPGVSYCGSTRQDNRACASWVEFYRERRLRPLLAALGATGLLSVADQGLYERLFTRLPELLSASSSPALIHGDLWSGNVMNTARGPALVDPACAFAAREMDFGISTLFGGFSERAFAAYEEASPLPAGWLERNPLYQLYHLLNHAVLFGGRYADDARRIASRFVGG